MSRPRLRLQTLCWKTSTLQNVVFCQRGFGDCAASFETRPQSNLAVAERVDADNHGRRVLAAVVAVVVVFVGGHSLLGRVEHVLEDVALLQIANSGSQNDLAVEAVLSALLLQRDCCICHRARHCTRCDIAFCVSLHAPLMMFLLTRSAGVGRVENRLPKSALLQRHRSQASTAASQSSRAQLRSTFVGIHDCKNTISATSTVILLASVGTQPHILAVRVTSRREPIYLGVGKLHLVVGRFQNIFNITVITVITLFNLNWCLSRVGNI